MKIGGGGLVDVAVEAYSRHHHLVLRPDDVWIAILSQFSFYINAHAEELRHTFVAHEGKKALCVEASGCNRYTVDFAHMARSMGDLLKENVKDPQLCEWIMAEFSTTTVVDRTVYAIEMMATMKKYFSYKFSLLCGLPGVTLEGTKADWSDLLSRISKLETFGDEPKTFAQMLRSVLTRFVRSFDVFSSSSGNEEEKADLREFFNKIAHHDGGGSGPTFLSGWITAFCPWNADGEWMDHTCAPGTTPPTRPNPDEPRLVSGFPSPRELRASGEALVLDSTTMFPIIDTDDVPRGFVEVDVKLDDNGQEFDTVMVAGHLGGRVLGTKADEGEEGEEKLGVAAGWFMFVKDPKKVEEVEEKNTQRGA